MSDRYYREYWAELIADLVEALKRKDYDHVAKLINEDSAYHGIIVSAKELRHE
jgi:hypothetical protein